MFDDHTQEADFLFVEFALSRFQEEVVLSQNFQYLTSSLNERFSCLGVDEDVVQNLTPENLLGCGGWRSTGDVWGREDLLQGLL